MTEPTKKVPTTRLWLYGIYFGLFGGAFVYAFRPALTPIWGALFLLFAVCVAALAMKLHQETLARTSARGTGDEVGEVVGDDPAPSTIVERFIKFWSPSTYARPREESPKSVSYERLSVRFRQFWTPLRIAEAAAVAAVILITLWQLQPNLLLSTSTVTGGDMGSHFALPAYLRSSGNPFNLAPWYPGWYAGMPAYAYYFVIPDFFAAIAGYFINFAVAFKLATVMGSVLLPVCAYLMGRLIKAPRPIPAALAVFTLPFLFDASFTIDGGNLFSTMAGEYAFSLSLALALLTIGLFARGVRTGKGYWVAAIALSFTLAAHVLPWFFALAAIGVLVVIELLRRLRPGTTLNHPIRFAVGAGIISFGLSAWWLISFATSQSLTNSMGYVNDSTKTLHDIFTTLGWFNASGGAGGDRWIITLAAIGFVVALIVRDRLGVLLAAMAALGMGAFAFDPQSVIWNERLVPFWYISIYLLGGWLVGYTLYRWVERKSLLRVATKTVTTPATDDATAPVTNTSLLSLVRIPDPEAMTPEKHYRRGLMATIAVIIIGVGTTLPALLPPVASALGLNTSGNQVSSWAQWNYSGYQAKPAWPEFNDIIQTMDKVTQQYGCGRAMWEYNSSENRFGTPEALMTLPTWTNNCVDSMEGLLFESSATTPYHFLDQAELSVSPSNPQVGLPYGSLNVAQGVRHLQMLGVKYFIAFSPEVIAQANADKSLVLAAKTKAWPSPGTTWYIYRVLNSDMVEPLTNLPNVIPGISSRAAWLSANVDWWLNPTLWTTPIAASGPANWPRATSVGDVKTVPVSGKTSTTLSGFYLSKTSPFVPTLATSTSATTTSSSSSGDSVTKTVVRLQSISFHVSKIGVPVLVKISYYPRWHAQGATGPYRVSPNLMVVIPTSHDVTLAYGSSPAVALGDLISFFTVVTGITVFVILRRRHHPARSVPVA